MLFIIYGVVVVVVVEVVVDTSTIGGVLEAILLMIGGVDEDEMFGVEDAG